MAEPVNGLRKAAVLLIQMGAERSSKVLSQLREAEVGELTGEIVGLGGVTCGPLDDVAIRIAVMERTNPETIRSVEKMLERKISSVLDPGEMTEVGGVQPLVEIINRADRATERLILEGLEGRDPALADQVRSQMFVFEDIVTLDDKAVQLVLRQVESAELATALKGIRDDVRDKVLHNMSERAAE